MKRLMTALAMTAALSLPVTANAKLYVDPNNPAKRQMDQWKDWPDGRNAMAKIAFQPTAKWYGGWGDTESDARRYVDQAGSDTAQMVAYNIPYRDCGGYSSGGSGNYYGWIDGLSRAISGRHPIVILEPDALSGIDCLDQGKKDERYALLSMAVEKLSGAGAEVYIDAGHSNWTDAEEMANRLRKANVGRAAGFSLNVSNFNPTGQEIQYGRKVSDKVGGKPFIVDTSRNGNGWQGTWCNPWNIKVGDRPQEWPQDRVRAYLWVKTVGESDGWCNGGKAAGEWDQDKAYDIARKN